MILPLHRKPLRFMLFLYLKAVHIVFIVTWFAGLFYMVRLFIYQVEAAEKEEPARTLLGDQLKLMASRLWYIITWPSAVISLVVGLWILYLQAWHLDFAYMWIKLGLVVLLYVYHFISHRIYNQLQKDIVKVTSGQMRMWNEVATVLLIAIIFLIVIRSALGLVWGMVGLVVLIIVMMVAIKAYKRHRQKKGEKV